ncbi:MAG: BON domain-containing protein [Gammaproteobacteria bacterium]|nr:BON domain-containing protein [Gammaproteobacteria bacterium]
MRTCCQRYRKARAVFATAALLALSYTLGGCESYLEDSPARTVGEFTDDATIQLIVKKRLVGARDIRGMRINVEVHKGVVTLIGEVRSEDERQRALEIAAAVPNVAKVVDQLELP